MNIYTFLSMYLHSYMLFRSALVVYLLLIVGVGLVNAQSGNVKGTVKDDMLDDPLPGASVVIKGTSTGTSTNIDGEFSLFNLPAGEIEFIITFIGYEPQEKKVTIVAGQTIAMNVGLEMSLNTLTEITITGSLEGQQRALNQQRTSDNIKNIVSADLIGRFPDLNVAEALQRVPGINIQRDKGEGSTVSIRGTPQHFTAIQINGEQMPSVQQSGVRNEGLDLIPADQLSSMEITKAPTPDMDGDAIGGVINLKTPTARKTRLGMRAESALGFNDISGGLNGIGRLRFDRRFLTNSDSNGKLGVLVGTSYYSTNNSEHRTDGNWLGLPRPIPPGQNDQESLVMENYQFRNTVNERERIGATATIDYKFNQKNEIVFNYMYNRREDNDMRNRLRFDLDRGIYESLDSIRNARIRRDINIFDELKENQSFNLQGFHTLGNWQVDWSGYYTVSKRIFSSDRGDFAHDGIDVVADNPGGIFNDVPRFRPASNERDMYDPFL
ncbi:MAG: carboxypeptidase-like regulatory domain-containing protein, partial [Cyclobacteriaceae bacterium]